MKKVKLRIGNIVVKFILWLSRRAKIDLLPLALSNAGYGKSYSLKASGELSFVRSFLPKLIDNKQPIILDVGANLGEYSVLLQESFPNSKIYSFEPNPNTFAVLKKNLPEGCIPQNFGLGITEKTDQLYFDEENTTSVQATSDKEILETIAKTKKITSTTIKIERLDEFCAANNINHIDFLKIDTEGFEMEVLQGAGEFITKKKIHIIQFEFNEVNIVKRQFLKDFFEILNQYDFFRLDENKMIPLKTWEPKLEIFLFQNIVAIRK